MSVPMNVREYIAWWRSQYNPITGEQRLFKELTDEMFWNGGRQAVLTELEREFEKLHVYTDSADEDGLLDLLGKDEVLEIIRSKKGGA